ncbi:MAG: SDR family NAD(P)-dependent oxidoreductase [Gammaproteobacteria bacterium]|nr:SDR family NAD(P)-dependent oxidoreductase [Gammaproteobacteria bacterium]
MTTLAGYTALVTGGGTGIGEAIAYDLADAGVKVTVCGRRAAPLDETVERIIDKGGEANAVTADMTNPDDIEALAAGLIESQGGVDILVNNAGFSSKVRSARYIDADEWRSVMDVNTMGPAMLTRALLQPMIDKGRGDVVMISSMAAIRPGIMAGVVYSAAKTAAKAYMDVLAMEVRRYGVRCTTVYPGEVDTPILENRALPPDAEARAKMMQSEDISATVMMALSLPHRATVSEIAITATVPRDMSADIKAAMDKKSA